MEHGDEDAEGEEREGVVPEDHQLTRSSNPRTARAEEAGRRRFRARPAARWSSSTSPLGASQLDSLDGVVEDDAAERLDILPGLG